MDAQLDTAAAQRGDPHPRQQRMRVVGVVGVHHPLVLAVAEHGQVGVGVDDRETEHVACERDRPGRVLDEQVDSEPAQDRP